MYSKTVKHRHKPDRINLQNATNKIEMNIKTVHYRIQAVNMLNTTWKNYHG